MASLNCALLLVLVVAFNGVTARQWQRCELARELLNNGVPRNQIATWVCIADHESNLQTWRTNTANTDGSTDHGIFQINDRYWCGPGKGCVVSCDNLKNDDLRDDIKCVRQIFNEFQQREGNGFRAWTVYSIQGNCKSGGQTSQYTNGCGI